MAVRAVGAQRAITSSVNAPFPQPTSSHARFFGASSQSRKIPATARLQRPIRRSYAAPSVKNLSGLLMDLAIRAAGAAQAGRPADLAYLVIAAIRRSFEQNALVGTAS